MLAQAQSGWTPKLLWLVIPSLLGGLIWWYVVGHTLAGRLAFSSAGLPTLLFFIVFGFFSFGLWLGAIGLIGYVSRGRLVPFASALVVSLPMLGFFPLTSLTIGVMAATVMIVWWSIERFTHDADSRLQVKPHLSFGWALPTIILLMMAVVSLLYYQQLRGSTKTADELAERLGGQTVSLAERFLPLLTKDYRPDMAVDELIGLQVPTASELLKDIQFDQLNQQELEQRLREALGSVEGFPAEEFQVEPATTQAEFEAALDLQLTESRRQLSQEVRKRLSDQFQVPIEGDAGMHEVLTAVVNKQFERYISKYVTVIPWLLALALFFILRIFSGFFLLFAAWLGWLLLWLYRHLHILHVGHETVPAERVEWGK